ncbi:MAG: excisionase family DNA-binding protein [Planctomycetota bacterium]
MKTYIGVKEVAKRLGLTDRAVYMRVARDQLPYIRLGPRTIRFDEDILETWLRKRVCVPKMEDDGGK